MVNIYKRFGEWVTGLRSNLFTWARIKLTATYLLIIVIILTVFSLILYANLDKHLRRDFGNRQAHSISGGEENPIEDALERLETSIITADIVVLVIAGGLSYALAGYTLKPIRQALNAQARFSAEASHELRTPLSVMRTDIEVLFKSNQVLSQEVKSVLKSNLEEIQTMSVMTEQLLALSRGKNYKIEHWKRLNIKELAANLVTKLSGIASNKKISLSLVTSADAFVFGSEHDLERMLNNIIINALSYTKEDGTITVEVSSYNKLAELSVVDTGLGIPTKDLPHVFEAFYKTDTPRSLVDNHQGVGLGLAIVKEIIEQHHGSVEIKSIENKGTTVIIRLPLAKTDAELNFTQTS